MAKMTQVERNRRRALIARRQAARRMSQAQREIWRRRREAQGEDLDEGLDDDAISNLPDVLLG
jgi:hypothetical protein